MSLKAAVLFLGFFSSTAILNALECFGHRYASIDTHKQFSNPQDQGLNGLCSSFARANILSAVGSRSSGKRIEISPLLLALHDYLSDPQKRNSICRYDNHNGYDPFAGGDSVQDTDDQLLKGKQCLLMVDNLAGRDLFQDFNSFFSEALPESALRDLSEKDYPAKLEELKLRLTKNTDSKLIAQIQEEIQATQRKILLSKIIMELRSEKCTRKDELADVLLTKISESSEVVSLPPLKLFDPSAQIKELCQKGKSLEALQIIQNALCLGLPVLNAIREKNSLSYRRVGRETYAKLLSRDLPFNDIQKSEQLFGMQHANVITGVFDSAEGPQLCTWDSNVGGKTEKDEKHLMLFDSNEFCKLGPFRIVATEEEFKVLQSDAKTQESFHLKRKEENKVISVGTYTENQNKKEVKLNIKSKPH